MDVDLASVTAMFRTMGLSASAVQAAFNDPRMRDLLGSASPSLPAEDDIASQLQRAREQFEREKRLGPSSRTPVPRAALAMAMDRSRNELQDALKGPGVLQRNTTVGFPKHSSNTPLEQLTPITLSKMQVRRTHFGSYLLCRTYAAPSRFVAISLAIEDTDGQAQMLSVYNLPGAFLASLDTLDELLPPGTVLVLREPTLKMDNEGQNAFIRVDSPTDVVFLTDDHPIARGARWQTNAPRSRLPDTAEAWKERGNVHFKHGRHFAASIA
ncbi:hypothetical protein EXIGLDRAFT_783014, partial [Exidia glandulosa HHB12029]